MIKVTFKNVGQGDSILIEWQEDEEKVYGIIDCNLYFNSNPLLDELKIKNVQRLKFIILSHLHYDHYSGLNELLEFTLQNNITIDAFFHTFTVDFTYILDRLLVSQKEIKNTELLLETLFEKCVGKNIKIFDGVTDNSLPIKLTKEFSIKFFSPKGEDSVKIANLKSRYKNKISTTIPDMNIMSTILLITNNKEAILLTSDGTKSAIKRIIKIIEEKICACQVPHHGSSYNLNETFWNNLLIENKAPAVFSVGESVKDKLPNKEVVEFFENRGFENKATNEVYGIAEYYETPKVVSANSKNLINSINHFAIKKIQLKEIQKNPRFNGDQVIFLNNFNN